MKTLDCSRCWFSKPKAPAKGGAADKRHECAHPEKARVLTPVKRMLSPTGLVQLVSCPKER
ncbi:MAG: hypothetical protein JNM66_27720 [Bryobacterales bacterium]|nr:hypothetical protein [Bryobacterales bacterium]